ncbi:MAG: hypothetical protein EP338_01910 [Bacteroidetes bacterium]|nr:MAG: hypothetical protein EP338_01910 [Bacteroidota bacterium]
MKLFVGILGLLLLASCGIKVPYTNDIKQEYNLTESNLKRVQFFTSSTIILQRKNSVGNQKTNDDGTLVSNENSVENRIIIPVNTKCIFESVDEDGTMHVRFETGKNKTLAFAMRKGQTKGRFYLEAKWDPRKGGELDYGNLTYYATAESGGAFLLVATKKLKRTRRKDRIVKGMKV